MDKFISIILLLMCFNVQADNNWLKKFTEKNNFTYSEFRSMIDDSNKDSFQKLFVFGYYSGVINSSRALNAISEHEKLPTLYCINADKRITVQEYILYMNSYYLSLSHEQKQVVDNLPLEIVHLRTLTNIFPCNKTTK